MLSTILLMWCLLSVTVEAGNGPLKFGFTASSLTGDERGEMYTVEVGFLSDTINQQVSFTVSLLLDTAGGSDVILLTDRGVVPPNSNQQVPISFMLTQDGVAQELDETFQLKLDLTDLDPSLLSEFCDTLDVTILDTDVVTLALIEDDFREIEMPGAVMPVRVGKDQDVRLANPVMFVVTPLTIEQALQRGVIPDFPPEDFNSPTRADDDDFDPSVLTITFPADEDQFPISDVAASIPIVDDDVNEAPEQFFIVTLGLVEALNPDLIVTDERNVSTCIINDNDPVQIGFAEPVYEFREPVSGSVNIQSIMVTRDRDTEQQFFVAITVTDPTSPLPPAQLESADPSIAADYSVGGAPGNTLTQLFFLPFQQSLVFSFNLFADSLEEGVEGFQALTAPVPGFPAFLPNANPSTEIRILDSIAATVIVGFEELDYTVSEAAGSVDVCVVVIRPTPDEDLVSDIFLHYETIAGTADEDDFIEVSPSEGSFIFAASPGSGVTRRQCLEISIVNDELDEPLESFRVMLSLAPEQAEVAVDPSITEILILDDDDEEEEESSSEDPDPGPIKFGFAETTFTGVERGEGYVVEVGFLTGRLNRVFQYSVELVLETAGSGDVIVGTTGGTISQELSQVDFSLLLDGVAQEMDETFRLRLVVPSFVANQFDEFCDTFDVTILDSDVVSFSLTEEDYRVEEMPNAMMPVRIGKDATTRLANPVTFRLTPLTVDQALDLGVISDYPIEDPLSPNRANEDDFDTTVLTVTFPADENLPFPISDVAASIPIEDDDINEASEQEFVAVLDLLEAQDSSRVVVDRNVSICLITDNDAISIGFAAPNYNFMETDFETLITDVTLIKQDDRLSEQTFQVGIEVSEPPGGVRSAQLQTTDPNVDYDYRIGPPGESFVQLLFSPALQSISFNFFVNADDLVEDVEFFQATVLNVAGSPVFQPPMFPAVQSTLIRISDNDKAVVGFKKQNYTVGEGDGSVEVCVTVTNPQANEELPFGIFLTYTTSTGSADGVDFTEVSPFQEVLAFEASEGSEVIRRQCIEIFIQEDGLVEDTESFTVTLTLDPLVVQDTERVIVDPPTTEVFIVDNDVSTTESPTTEPATTEPATTEPATTEPATTEPDTTEPATTVPETTEPVTTDCPAVEGALYFELNGETYQSGSSVLITQVGSIDSNTGVANPDSSLVCVTSDVNTECCRGRDGGNVGEWLYPDGTLVPRRRDNPSSDFLRSAYSSQVRLNRRNNVIGPTGTYTCVVPREDGCRGLMHTAVITLEHPMPTFLRCLCAVCVWNPPQGRFDIFPGYDIRYFIPDSDTELVLSLDERNFFQVVPQEARDLGQEELYVQVRVRLTETDTGPWTEPVMLCPV